MQSNERGDSNASEIQPNSPPPTSLSESDARRLGFGGMRSSSPAKRSASERDEAEQSHTDMPSGDGDHRRSPKKSNVEHQSPMPNRFKAVNETSRLQRSESADQDSEHSQARQTASNQSGSEVQSGQDTEMSNASSNSTPPSYTSTSTSMDPESRPPGKLPDAEQKVPSFDEQVAIITEMATKMEVKEGTKGFLLSANWLRRVLSRTTNGMHEGHPKEAREGEVGPIDNSKIVRNDNFYGDLEFASGERFVPLIEGLLMDDDFIVLPQQAWDLVVKWYGYAEESHIIVRFVHDTSEHDATSRNLQFELYPPIFTVQKLRNDAEGMSMKAMQEKDMPAVSLVASRADSYQPFLKRLKAAAEIQMTTKVKVWQLREASNIDDVTRSPVSSRANSPVPQSSFPRVTPKLVVDLNAFTSLAEGTQRTTRLLKDHTADEKYNGHLRLGEAGFTEDQTLILEEQVKANSEEYISDKLKKSAAQSGVDLQSHDGTDDSKQSPTKSQTNATGAYASRRSPTPSGIMTRGQTNRKGKARGTVGLGNLGNTCYMNSALQCIRSVEELSLYFLTGKSKEELNPDNPLGHHGAIASSYNKFLQNVYEAGNSSSYSPRDFKSTLGRCQPLFSGYGQQDSQEFLSFLVDGLHEDLNRIHKKPYRENPDSDDKLVHDPDYIKQLGQIYRDNHHARNDSIAMDLFNGFYKNTMVCPICSKISVTFDPFSLVTLQLPIETTFQHKFLFYPLQGKPIYIKIDIDKNSSIAMLKEYVARRVPNGKAENLIVAEQFSTKFYKVFEDVQVISEAQIQQNDHIVVLQLDAQPTNWPPLKKKLKLTTKTSEEKESNTLVQSAAERLAVPVIHRSVENTRDFILHPGMILLTKEDAMNYDTIFRKVLRSIDVLTTRDLTHVDSGPTRNGDNSSDDAVIMKSEDTSEDSGVQTRSIEGESDMVDVTMTNASAPNDEAATQTTETKPSLLTQAFLNPGLYNMFELDYYSAANERIPCGYSTLRPDDRLQSIRGRCAPRASSRRPSSSSWTSQNKDDASPVTSDDEISKDNGGALDLPDGSDSEEDNSGHKNFLQRHHISPFHRKKKNGVRTVRKSQRAGSAVPQNESLIRLNEGIVVTWTREGLAQLFDGAPDDDLRGRTTLDDIQTLEDPELDNKIARRNARKKQGVSLEECFEETSKSEVLSEENAWYCGQCKELRRATKTLEIWTVPDILVVHLKRFSSSSRLRDKVDVMVDYPTEGLDLTGKVGLPEGKSLIYDLFAVDNHYGGLGGGHYTAYAQNFFDKKWYDYNDSMVSQTQPLHVVTKAAYILFYRRRTPQNTPLGPPYLQQIIKDAYAGGDSTESGEDQRRDGTSSPNGSSGSSLEAAAAANHHEGDQARRAGSAGGRHGLESTARSALIKSGHHDDEQLPSYYGVGANEEMDEADDPLPSVERPRIVDLNAPPSWSFAGLPISELENDIGADRADSMEPVIGDVDDQSDFEDGSGSTYVDAGDQYGRNTPQFDDDDPLIFSENIGSPDGAVKHIEYSSQHEGQDDQVAVIQLSDGDE